MKPLRAKLLFTDLSNSSPLFWQERFDVHWKSSEKQAADLSG